jgi:putative addiction module CopG family antidote
MTQVQPALALSWPSPLPRLILVGMNAVTLPPELQRFAEDAIASGRYRDVSDLVVAGISLLQRQEAARAELLASVVAAKVEADRDGYLTGDEVAERVRATITRRADAAT